VFASAVFGCSLPGSDVGRFFNPFHPPTAIASLVARFGYGLDTTTATPVLVVNVTEL